LFVSFVMLGGGSGKDDKGDDDKGSDDDDDDDDDADEFEVVSFYVNGLLTKLPADNSTVGVLRVKAKRFAKSRIYTEGDRDAVLLSNYHVLESEERLTAQGRIGGGAPKRTREGAGGGATKLSKEEMLDEITEELRLLSMQVSDVGPVPVLSSAVTKVAHMAAVAGQPLIASMSRENLNKLSSYLEGTNGEHKVAQFSRLLFAVDLSAFKDIERHVRLLKESMVAATKRCLVVSFGADKGDIQWTVVRQTIDTARQAIDVQSGMTAARAAAA
jgi:hypothetical protein